MKCPPLTAFTVVYHEESTPISVDLHRVLRRLPEIYELLYFVDGFLTIITYNLPISEVMQFVVSL